MKTVEFEYGQGYMAAELPDGTEVFVPGETVPDPPVLKDIRATTRESIQQPIGMSPIAELVGPGSKVTISFPDRVKGGFQSNSHRKTCIPILVEECMNAGVREGDIRLICSNGLHRKNTKDEIRRILGDEIYDRFMPRHQIVNHDSEDWDNLVDLGYDELGDRVIMNREVFESDKPVLVDFWATWCMPCKMVAPIVEEVSREYNGRCKVAKLNIDDAMEIATKFGVMNIPTIMLFKGGKEFTRVVGVVPKETITKKIEEMLA